jgi:hypothetical protein
MGMIGLLRQTSLEARQSRFVDMLDSSATSLMGVINDILDVTKIEAGRLELERTTFSPRDAVEQVTRVFAASAQAKTIVQEVAAAVQQAAHGLIGTVVTRCLKSVGFGYDFELEFVGKRGKTEVIFWFIKDGVKHRPYDMVPGGALDIAAFGCRLVAVMTSLPPRRRVLFLDEPFKNVQGEPYRSNLPGMLAVLADEFGFQFFMIANTTAEVDLGEVIII